MSKVVGKVTTEEKNELLDLFRKKIALESLIKGIDSENEKLYDKMMTDYGTVVLSFNDWWSDKSNKYKWAGKEWSINFATNEITVENQNQKED